MVRIGPGGVPIRDNKPNQIIGPGGVPIVDEDKELGAPIQRPTPAPVYPVNTGPIIDPGSDDQYGHTPPQFGGMNANELLLGYGLLDGPMSAQVVNLVELWMDKLRTGEIDVNTVVSGFLADLYKTDWYNEYDESYRAAELLRVTDPATWEANFETRREDANRLIQDLGLTGILSDEEIDDFVDDWLHSGIDDASEFEEFVLDAVYDGSSAPPVLTEGSIKQAVDEINLTASNWLVDLPEGWALDQALAVKKEEISAAAIDQRLSGMVMAQYDFLDKEWVDNLFASGSNLTEHLFPHQKLAQGILEDATIDQSSDIMKQHRVVIDRDTGSKRFATTGELEKMLRNTDEYKKTSSYKQSSNSMQKNILQLVGYY